MAIPHLPLSVAAFCGAKKSSPYLRKVLSGEGEWPVALQATSDRGWNESHPAVGCLASEPQCPDLFSPALRKTHARANPLKPEDIARPAIGVKLSLARRPSILAEESSVT